MPHHYATLSAFTDKANKTHADKYDYDRIEFPIRAIDIITIVCKVHGAYTQRAYGHIGGSGCNECSKANAHKRHPSKMTFDDFVLSCTQKFNKFCNYKTPDVNEFSLKCSLVSFECPIHGYQQTKASAHRNSSLGCPDCYAEYRSDRQTIGHQAYLEKAIKAHGDKFEYPFIEAEFKNSASIITARCKIHGDFKTNARAHLRVSYCPKCAYIASAQSNRKQVKDIITQANKIHNNFYDYSLVTAQVKTNKHKIQIICPYHGIFSQSVNGHLRGSGCPKCALERNNPVSSQEIILRDWLVSLLVKCYHSYRPDFLQGQELDLFLPDYNLAIEVNGVYWHSLKDEHYHINKLNRCESNGIRLLQFYDLEINFNLDWVKSIILHYIGVNNDQRHVPIGILDRRLYSTLDCINYELLDPTQDSIDKFDKYRVWNSGYINNKGENQR